MEYTGKGQGNLNTVLGAVGTYGALGGGLLGNLFGGNNCNMDFIDVKTENAILKSELNTERKIVDIYNDLGGRINDLNTKVDSNAAAQAVINCGMQSATAVLQSQMAQVLAMTKLVIPSTNVCTGSSGTTVG